MALQMHQLQLLSVMHEALHSIVAAPTLTRRATAEAQLFQLAHHRDALAQSSPVSLRGIGRLITALASVTRLSQDVGIRMHWLLNQ